MKPQYIAVKINKKDEFYGKYHGCMDDNKALCGKDLNENWYLFHLNKDINCKKCLKVLNESTTEK